MPEPGSNLAYLSLGSNVRAEANLPAAVNALARYGCVRAVSRVWETPPDGFTDQSNFLNAAILLETDLSAHELSDSAIKDVERMLLRVRDASNKNGPRTIDVDLALFNRDVVQIGHRRIPDPDIAERAYLAVPLAELDPDYLHPDLNQTLADIARRLMSLAKFMRLRPDVVLPDPAGSRRA